MDAGFWQKYVFDFSLSAPTIRHAMVALGGIHETYLSQRRSLSQGNAFQIETPLAAYSLQKYGQAIQCLNSRLNEVDRNSDMVEETLVAALLFSCFEIIQGNDIAALCHLEGGLYLFTQVRKEPSRPSKLFVDRDDLVSSSLIKAFERLDLQASTFIESRQVPDVERQIESQCFPTVALPMKFGNLSEARDHLNSLSTRAYRFLRSSIEMYKYVPDLKPMVPGYYISPALATASHIPISTFQDRDMHIKALKAWSVLYKDLVYCTFQLSGDRKKTLNEAETREYAKVWTSYLVTLIKVSTFLNQSEMKYDSHLKHFEAIIEQADTALNPRPSISSSNSNPEKYDFTVEMSVIHPLYFTAIKCRSPSLRRKAVALLRKSGKEGVWDGHIMARIAEHVIFFEEGGTYDDEAGAPLPESRRLHGVGFNYNRPSRVVWVQCIKRRIVTSPSFPCNCKDGETTEWASGSEGEMVYDMYEEELTW